jgi:hypothetical protein
MKVVYSFYGKLPIYSIATVKQMRIFFTGEIYFIINDMQSPYVSELTNMNVSIIDFKDVEDVELTKIIKETYDKFCYAHKLVGREELFIRSFERFFLLKNLMLKNNLTDIFFVELDNLIYEDPTKWLTSFQEKEMAYMFDNYDMCSSGIAYIKNVDILNKFTNYCKDIIINSNDFLSEMKTLYKFLLENKDKVQILPTHWIDTSKIEYTYENFSKYNNSVFDALPVGIYLTGIDPVHSQGILTLRIKSEWSSIDFTKYNYEWRLDEQGRKIPYMGINGNWVKINNLHVHSKDLEPYLSI